MKSIFLIDPNDSNTDTLIGKLNKYDIPSDNLWLGCSTTPGNKFKSVIDMLENNFTLFPGRIDQILENYKKADSIIIPRPFPITPISMVLEKTIIDIKAKNPDILKKSRDMMYILTSTQCSAARVLSLDNVPVYEDISEHIRNSNIKEVYIEGGSRNIVDKDYILNLLGKIKKDFSKKTIYYGGGIDDIGFALELLDKSDYIVFSHLIHKYSHLVDKIMQEIN